MADQDVGVYNWKEMPQYSQPERVLMLFPGPVSIVFVCDNQHANMD